MSDMKISLPGSEVVTITGQTIDKLIRAGDGDAALLYLYVLRTHGQKTASEAAIALDKSKGWVNSAMAVLSRMGLVHLDDGYRIDETLKEPLKEPRQYTEQEITKEILSGSDFSVVVDETQRKLGKILSPDEMLRLYGIYENLRLPAEVILQLITHCIAECRITGDGRAPSVRYIEKAAFTWEREGIFTLDKAEDYLKALEVRKSVRGEYKRALQIWDRELSATEKRYVDDWVDMKFESGVIAIAYDKTVVKTGNLAWPYIDKILKTWHSKGLHTVQQVVDYDSGGGQKSAGAGAGAGTGVKQSQGGWRGSSTAAQKHGEPSSADMERMKKLLDKTKRE